MKFTVYERFHEKAPEMAVHRCKLRRSAVAWVARAIANAVRSEVVRYFEYSIAEEGVPEPILRAKGRGQAEVRHE